MKFITAIAEIDHAAALLETPRASSSEVWWNTMPAPSVAHAIDDVVQRLRVEPNPFTPNSDGVNDASRITYDILRVVEDVPVTLEVYDLSGRAVRSWTNDRAVGSFAEEWDGTDNSGNHVPPGSTC